MTSCRDRALDEFESTSWWDFMDASNQSPAFRTYLVEGLTRCLVAAKAREANVRAGGVVLTQLFYGLFSGETIDWVLNGPTDEAWLDPWKSYLDQAGVKFVMDAEVTAIALVNDRVSEVAFRQGGRMQTATADYCVGALPVEVMQALWSPQMRALNPQFAMNLDWLATQVDWMTGIQYFMPARIDLTQGHVTFIDSPWALTAISQPQFWPQVDLTQYGDGTLPGIISIDISEWERAGSTGKSAKQCTADEIADEVWHQMVERLNVGGAATLPVATPPHRLLDPNIEFDPLPVRNNAQLFINKVHSWPKRPTVRTPIRNFYLASDYLQTETNLATMEAANEAARSAVQAIIDASGVAGDTLQDLAAARPLRVLSEAVPGAGPVSLRQRLARGAAVPLRPLARIGLLVPEPAREVRVERCAGVLEADTRAIEQDRALRRVFAQALPELEASHVLVVAHAKTRRRRDRASPRAQRPRPAARAPLERGARAQRARHADPADRANRCNPARERRAKARSPGGAPGAPQSCKRIVRDRRGGDQGVKRRRRKLVDQRVARLRMPKRGFHVAVAKRSQREKAVTHDRIAVIDSLPEQELEPRAAAVAIRAELPQVDREQAGDTPHLRLHGALFADHRKAFLEQGAGVAQIALMEQRVSAQDHAGLPAEPVPQLTKVLAAADARGVHVGPARVAVEVDAVELGAEPLRFSVRHARREPLRTAARRETRNAAS